MAQFCVCADLQNQMFQAGVLWNLLLNLFHYDFTLDEGGVASQEASNQQVRWSNSIFFILAENFFSVPLKVLESLGLNSY